MMFFYVFDFYWDDLVYILFKQFLFIIVVVILLSWILVIWFVKYLLRFFVLFEKYVKWIFEQDWDDLVIVDWKDEIGKLGYIIEEMC